VYFEDGRYRYKPKDAEPVELGPDFAAAMTAYGKLVQKDAEKKSDDGDDGPWWSKLRTMGDWGDAYMVRQAIKNSVATQISNWKEWKKLRPGFAHLLPSEVSQKLMKKYVRARAVKALVRANREKALLSAMLSWIVAETDQEVLAANPLFGMKKKDTETSEVARDRLVLDRELDIFMSCGGEKLVRYCELKDMTRLRQKDILVMEVSQLKADGIEVMPSKSRRRHPRTNQPIGKRRFYPWNDKLLACVDRLREIKKLDEKRQHKITPWLMVTREGKCYYNFEKANAAAFYSLWRTCMRKAQAAAKAQGWVLERFTEHDLRARAGGSAKLLGNTEAVFKKHYDRGPEVVEPLRRGS
jgi:hypothetical protein